VIAGIEEDEPEWLLNTVSGAANSTGKPRLPPKISGNDYCRAAAAKSSRSAVARPVLLRDHECSDLCQPRVIERRTSGMRGFVSSYSSTGHRIFRHLSGAMTK